MDGPATAAAGWRGRIRGELVEYGINVLYLSLVFAAFTVYRRLTLAAHGIQYTNYGVAVIEGLVLGKVIMVGGMLRLGRGLESRPLLLSTFVKTVVFTLFVAAFKVFEHGARGLWTGEGFTGGVAAYLAGPYQELVAHGLVVFVALFPFFAIKELGRVLGRGRIRGLFLRGGGGPAE